MSIRSRINGRVFIAAAAALLLAVGLSLAGVRSAHADGAYSEQEGHYGVNTFTNYHNASGVGPRIDPYAWVVVSCKVYDPYIASVNPDGYWYRIASSPWNNSYYAPANTFYNGDPIGGPYTHNTDFNVPDCGASPPPPPALSIQLAQGPAAPAGYRYAVTLSNFAPDSSVSVSCSDSVDPGGFYTFNLATDGAGNAYTESQCYSGDGPDHWVNAGGVESNHVSWGSNGSTTTQPPPTTAPPSGGGTTPTPPPAAPADVTPCLYALRWTSLKLSVGYTGQHRYYGNAYQAVQNWNHAGTAMSIAKGDGNANITFVDNYSNSGLFRLVYATTEDPTSSLNPSDKLNGAYIGTPRGAINHPNHIVVKINPVNISNEHLSDANITAVLTHELGHALGLAHSDACRNGSPSLMIRQVMKDPKTALRGLQPYDVAEFRKWYNLS